MMTLRQLRDDLLRKAWIELPEIAPAYLVDDAATALNHAIQQLWLAPGLDFATRKTRSLDVVQGERRYPLPSTVQTVLGPVRFGGVEIHPADSRADIEHYAARYLGTASESPGTPVAYWVETLRSSGGTDSAAAALWLAPVPASAGVLDYEAADDAPRYTAADLSTTQVVPVPHRYVEALLLPVARQRMTRSHFFRNEEHRAALEADYEAALAAFGLARPDGSTSSPQ